MTVLAADSLTGLLLPFGGTTNQTRVIGHGVGLHVLEPVQVDVVILGILVRENPWYHSHLISKRVGRGARLEMP